MTLLTLKSALLVTPSTAETVVLLEPTEVVKEPDGIVLVSDPDVELVTTTLSEHDELGAMTVPWAKVKVPSPIVALAVPGLQLVEAKELKLTRPTGYTSTSGADKVAETSA